MRYQIRTLFLTFQESTGELMLKSDAEIHTRQHTLHSSYSMVLNTSIGVALGLGFVGPRLTLSIIIKNRSKGTIKNSGVVVCDFLHPRRDTNDRAKTIPPKSSLVSRRVHWSHLWSRAWVPERTAPQLLSL